MTMMTSPFTASICAISTVVAAAVAADPFPLAIYYGIPSLVNGAAGDVDRAAETFRAYDVVVFGDGLEFDDIVPDRTPSGR